MNRRMMIPKQSERDKACESYFLCSRRAIPELLRKAQEERRKYLLEFRMYYNCNLDIQIYVREYFMGYSIAGKMLVNGEVVRDYEYFDLLLIDLDHLIMKVILRQREAYGK